MSKSNQSDDPGKSKSFWDDEMKKAAKHIFLEIKKDILFFGICGFLVGLLLFWQIGLSENSKSSNESWGVQLFNDFLSFNAFGFLFFGFTIFSAICNLFKKANWNWNWMQIALKHTEKRFMEISSSLISFMIGLISFFIVAMIVNKDPSGFELIIYIFSFVLFVLLSFIMAFMFSNEIKPFDKWWSIVISLIVLILSLNFLVFKK